MDCWKKCRVGLARQCFWFVQCVVEFDSNAGEGVFTCHHTFQSKNYKIDCVGSFDFHDQKDSGWDAQPTKNKHHQITGQVDQGEGKRKGGGHLLENCFAKNTCWLGKMEGFPSQGNLCSQSIDINPNNLVEG